MSLYINGAGVDKLYVNGSEMDKGYINGTEVHSGFSPTHTITGYRDGSMAGYDLWGGGTLSPSQLDGYDIYIVKTNNSTGACMLDGAIPNAQLKITLPTGHTFQATKGNWVIDYTLSNWLYNNAYSAQQIILERI